MPQRKILVDSNVYFRLAKEIHPLLQVEFGEQTWCLYIIDRFEDEYLGSGRLRKEFSWVGEDRYKKNRSRTVTLSRDQIREITRKIPFITEAAKDLKLTTGPVDLQVVAVAMVLRIPIATDDTDMRVLAEEYDVETIKALEVLKYLEDNRVIDRQKINAIVGYWDYLKDLPKDCAVDYERIFGSPPPYLD